MKKSHRWAVTLLLVILAFCSACCISMICLWTIRSQKYVMQPDEPQMYAYQ